MTALNYLSMAISLATIVVCGYVMWLNHKTRKINAETARLLREMDETERTRRIINR